MAEQDKIRLEIVTPEKEVFHAMVEQFTVPAVAGNTGVLYNHAPLITVLEPGLVVYTAEGEKGRIAIGKGFLEMRENEAEILVDTAELAADIDIARAMASAERARQRLANRQAGLDTARAEASLARALIRLKATQ